MQAMNDAAGIAANERGERSPMQKLAALLLMLQAENAVQIMRNLDERELEEVSSEMAKLTAIGQDLQTEVLSEFSPVALEAATAVSGGVKSVQNLLEKSVGTLRASDIIGRVSPAPALVAAMQEIADMDVRHIFNLLRHEQLQTIALVMSYLPPEKISQLLMLFRPETREQVVERLATMVPTSIEVVQSLAEMLHRKFVNNRTQAVTHTGGLKLTAQALNALPKDVSESILASLRERNSDLGDAVLKKMLTFDELQWLDSTALQKVLREIDMRSLAVALKTAGEKVKQSLFAAMTKRAAETVREEISFMGPLKAAEIDAAQTEIIETVRRLEGDGEIDLDPIRQHAR